MSRLIEIRQDQVEIKNQTGPTICGAICQRINELIKLHSSERKFRNIFIDFEKRNNL
jgi:hypothetical protein